MPTCRVEQSLQRVEMNGFAFPLGVYPVEELEPVPGYTLDFEPADGDDTGDGSDWEEWPDRYVFDILVPATKVESLCRALLTMLACGSSGGEGGGGSGGGGHGKGSGGGGGGGGGGGRIFPILDVLGHDAYREVDPYVSYDLLGVDRFWDTIRRYRAYFYEDGLVGFGAMCEEPFLYIFVDEHKIVTVRAEVALKERVEHILAAFELKEVAEIKGADAATHEHRSVLDAPEDRLDLLNADEIIEELRDDWHLALNIDPDSNVDAEGHELGVTGWRCVVRYDPPPVEKPKGEAGSVTQQTFPPPKYAEVYVTADCLNKALDLAFEGFDTVSGRTPDVASDEEADPVIVASDRMTGEEFKTVILEMAKQSPELTEMKVWYAEWVR